MFKTIISADAEGVTEQKLLEKRATVYDPIDKQLTWEIQMNHQWNDWKGMEITPYAPMTKVTMTDTLPAGLSYVDKSAVVKVEGASLSVDDKARLTHCVDSSRASDNKRSADHLYLWNYADTAKYDPILQNSGGY